jgi:inorganic phosphate transporter, PiT family
VPPSSATKSSSNIGHNILAASRLSTLPVIAIVAAAFLLTTLFTQRRIPTSTIQILVFCIIGAGGGLGSTIRWHTVMRLTILWVLAPFVSAGSASPLPDCPMLIPGFAATSAAGTVGRALIIVGGAASLTMGANDVSNATAVFLSTGFSGPLLAGLIGGVGLAAGVLTWGRPLLERVAFDVVEMEMPMATVGQLVQALVVLTAVFSGYFTSMNKR